jgi:hypothetical protein
MLPSFLYMRKISTMSVKTKKYSIHELKTGRVVAFIGPDGEIQDEGDPQAVAKLKELARHEIIVRENPLGSDDEEEYDPFPAESMCYLGLITFQPGDPEYLKAFLRRLPYITNFAARAVQE